MPKREGYKKRTKLEKEVDKERFLKLHLQKYSYSEIAEMCDVTRALVVSTINELTEEWKENNQEKINMELMKSLSVLDLVENEAWKGWARSQTDAGKEKITKENLDMMQKRTANLKHVKGLSEETITKTILEKWAQYGDPQFLNVIIRSSLAKSRLIENLKFGKQANTALEALAKLMGLTPEDIEAAS